MCNIFKAMGPLLAKTQLTPATQSEDRHVCIAYLYDYEDGSGLNEEHKHYGWWPRVLVFTFKELGAKGGDVPTWNLQTPPKYCIRQYILMVHSHLMLSWC